MTATRKRPADSLPIGIIRASFVPDFAAGTVRSAERPRDHFGTAKGFNNYNSNYVGKEALAVLQYGRCGGNFRFNGVRYGLSRARVIWALYHGKWPENEIGHRNGINSDDRIENLREQARSDSLITRRLTSRTGVVGVYPLANGRYYAVVRNRRKYLYVGSFDTLEEARTARESAALRMQGEFARVVRRADHAGGESL